MWFGGSTLIGLLLNSIILQTVPSLIHFQVSSTDLLSQFVLLVRGVVHEHERVALAIEILGIDFLDVGGIERIAAFIRPVEHRLADEVFEPALIKCLPLAWLDEIAFDHQIGIAVELDFQTLLELAGVVAGHGELPAGLIWVLMTERKRDFRASRRERSASLSNCNGLCYGELPRRATPAGNSMRFFASAILPRNYR